MRDLGKGNPPGNSCEAPPQAWRCLLPPTPTISSIQELLCPLLLLWLTMNAGLPGKIVLTIKSKSQGSPAVLAQALTQGHHSGLPVSPQGVKVFGDRHLGV